VGLSREILRLVVIWHFRLTVFLIKGPCLPAVNQIQSAAPTRSVESIADWEMFESADECGGDELRSPGQLNRFQPG
jgi:hypothetical protein